MTRHTLGLGNKSVYTSLMASGDILNREFLAERDNRMYQMRKAGVPTAEVARRFGISVAATNAAIDRLLTRFNREAMLAYPETLRLELERLDSLQAALWPQTQHRRVKLDDGTEVELEPDTKAIQQVLSIIDRRCRLMGMDATNINISLDGPAVPTPVLAGANGPVAISAYDPETEARQLIELMGSSGVLSPDMVNQLLAQPKSLEEPQDAQIIE